MCFGVLLPSHSCVWPLLPQHLYQPGGSMCVTMSNDGDHVKVGTEDGPHWPSLMCVLLARLMMGETNGHKPVPTQMTTLLLV